MVEQQDAPIPEIYTNSVNISASIYEFAITFGLTDPVTLEHPPSVRVRMSPQHAQAFAILLTKYIKHYGERFGEINLPDELVASLRDDVEIETEEQYDGSSEER